MHHREAEHAFLCGRETYYEPQQTFSTYAFSTRCRRRVFSNRLRRIASTTNDLGIPIPRNCTFEDDLLGSGVPSDINIHRAVQNVLSDRR